MATIHMQEIEIIRKRGMWSVHTISHWVDRPNTATEQKSTSHCYGASRTLAWAVYETADWAAKNNTRIVRLIVDGKAYPTKKAEAAIRKYTSGGLAYTRERALDTLAMPASLKE